MYSNLGYALAGEAIGRAAGSTWEDLLHQRVLGPLEMTTATARPPGPTPPRAAGHLIRHGRAVPTPHRDLRGPAPAGQLVASAKDAARWLLLHTGEPLLPRAAVQRTHQPQVDMPGDYPWPEMVLDGYGLGWGVGRYRGRAMVTHSGGIDGFLTQTLVLPEERIGVLVSANQHMSGLPTAAMLTLVDQLLDEGDSDWLARLREPEVEAKPVRQRARTSALAGRWSHPGYGELVVDAAGAARLGSGDLEVLEGENGLQLRFDPLDVDAELCVEEGAILAGFDAGTGLVRFARVE